MKPINRLDDRIFVSAYPGGGRDSYHPKMLTKVFVYTYTQRIFSSDRQSRSQECYVHVDCRENLRSEEGHALSVRRMAEPESVFGQIKNNRGFRRILLRGLHKVSLEVGWLSFAHNLLSPFCCPTSSTAFHQK
uniref:transposase n=1 Tax=Paenibacillus lautus TaxID=1401 RepID=UPI00398B1A4D